MKVDAHPAPAMVIPNSQSPTARLHFLRRSLLSPELFFILVLPTVGFSHIVSRKWASPDWYYNSGRMIRLFNVRGNSKFACWAAVFTPPSPFSPDRLNRPPPNRLRVGTLLTQPPVLWCRLGSSPATAREHSSHAAA